MDPVANEKRLHIAVQKYRYAIGKMPCPGAFASIHMLFKELSDHQFQMPHKPWLNPYELAALTNYTAMFGTDKRNHKLLFALDKPLNEFKKLWKLAEESNSYSDNPAYIAAFILRIVYQQLPYVIHPRRIPSMFSRMAFAVGLSITLISCIIYVVNLGSDLLQLPARFLGRIWRSFGSEAHRLRREPGSRPGKTSAGQKYKELYKNPLFNAVLTFNHPFPIVIY
jgi:hypothetical protein